MYYFSYNLSRGVCPQFDEDSSCMVDMPLSSTTINAALPPLLFHLHPASLFQLSVTRFSVFLACPNSCAAPSLPTSVPSPSFQLILSLPIFSILIPISPSTI